MKNVKFTLFKDYLYFLFSLILLLGSTCLTAQKNAIKGTPLKPFFDQATIGYERVFKDNWSLTADFHFWFQDKDGVDEVFFGSDERYNLKNKGLRYALELRKYINFKSKNEKIKHDINIAVSGYLGEHHIESTRFGYDETKNSVFPIFGSDPTHRSYKSAYFGEADILSGGIGLHFGYRILWDNGLFINGEIIGRKSWTNYGEDNYPTIPEDPTFPIEKVDFHSQINGNFLEPKLSIGFMF